MIYEENPWFGRLDSEILYLVVRLLRPKNIIEVGAGYSTNIMYTALKDNQTPFTFITVDPIMDRVIPQKEIIQVRSKLEDTEIHFELLGRNDILFIDSSHIFAPGNEVDILYNEVIPSLRSGVVVHIHDIFLPDDYPPEWADRGYDEQDLVKNLLETGDWEILIIVNSLAKILGASGGSLWIRRRYVKGIA